MDGEESLQQYSPEVLVQDPSAGHAVSLLPPIILFHGTADYSIPADARFYSPLKWIVRLHMIILIPIYFSFPEKFNEL